MEYLGLGAEITVSLAGPILIGFVIDKYLDITPWGTLTGVVLGLILFFLMIFRIIERLNNESEDKS
jgi:F0F1-type ATP synthase assembly protein I